MNRGNLISNEVPRTRPRVMRLSIQFTRTPPEKIKINKAVRNSTDNRTRNTIPSPFEIVALLEDPYLPLARKLELANRKLRALAGQSLPPPKKSRRQSASARQIEFKLEAPSAQSVRLVGDFTDWEKAALPMAKISDGVWQAAVPLKAGRYAYQFIVDGQWCLDPQRPSHEPNPFGTHNSLVEVDF